MKTAGMRKGGEVRGEARAGAGGSLPFLHPSPYQGLCNASHRRSEEPRQVKRRPQVLWWLDRSWLTQSQVGPSVSVTSMTEDIPVTPQRLFPPWTSPLNSSSLYDMSTRMS